jgi:HAD superfamily hydrolase (TIGR01509 family)
MTPKIVVFDLGKVLVDFDYSIAALKLAKLTRHPPEELVRLILGTPLLLRYEVGEISSTQVFNEFKKATGYTGFFAQFANAFADIFTEIPEMTALHAEIRAKKIPTYIFSNTNELAVIHIRNEFPFFACFDGYIYSYEVKCMKPDPDIYAALEKLSGCQRSEICYLDDRPENVAGGIARGWHGILHETPAKSRQEIRKLGIL